MGNFESALIFVLIVFAVYKYRDTRRFVAGAKFAKARVTKVEKVEHLPDIDNPHDFETYRYTLSFTASNGEQVEFVSGLEDRAALKSVGQSTQILYHVNRPQDARVASFWNLYFPPFVAVGAALAILLMSLAK